MVTYAEQFIIGIAIEGLLALIVGLYMMRLDKKNPYRPFYKAFAIVLAVAFVVLVISYIAQATFMGWI
jgi:VIT1/CCC1 family predicted Fe2+/Mn2+ transporter